jgi:hypothetical protein
VMKSLFVGGALLGLASLCGAAPVLVTGTPNYLGVGLNPTFGTIINFDDLAPAVSNSPTGFLQLSANQYAAQGVTSISNNSASSPLNAAVFSQQSAPVYLTTGPSDNYAGDITIRLAKAAGSIGVGIMSDDTTPVTLNALASDGSVLATFSVLTSSSSSTPENGYWMVRDSSNSIQGLEVISAANLGIDDVQFAPVPEPASVAMLGFGGLLLLLGLFRKEKQS